MTVRMMSIAGLQVCRDFPITMGFHNTMIFIPEFFRGRPFPETDTGIPWRNRKKGIEYYLFRILTRLRSTVEYPKSRLTPSPVVLITDASRT